MIFGGYIDNDAQKFVQAAGLTDKGQILAIARLVADLKGRYNRNYATTNVWDKMYTIYPFVGGTATSHAVNLKQPGTYNLTYSGAVTHSLTGFNTDGVSAYADTGFFPQNSSVLNNFHLSTYIRENKYEQLDTNGKIFAGTFMNTGRANSIGAYLNVAGNYTTSSLGLYWAVQQSTVAGCFFTFEQIKNANGVLPDIKGYHLVNRNISTYIQAYYNGDFLITGSNTSVSPTGTAVPIRIGGGAGVSPALVNASNREHAFLTTGLSLTATEAKALYNSIQNYQTLLNRQV